MRRVRRVLFMTRVNPRSGYIVRGCLFVYWIENGSFGYIWIRYTADSRELGGREDCIENAQKLAGGISVRSTKVDKEASSMA